MLKAASFFCLHHSTLKTGSSMRRQFYQTRKEKKTDVGSDGKFLRVFYLYKASSIGKVYRNEKFCNQAIYFTYTFFGRM